jgi:hypothetical protein
MWPHNACAVQPAATNSHPSVAAAVAAAGGGGCIQQHTIQAGSSARLAVLRLTLPQLGYDNMTGHEVLRQLLPAEVAQAQAALRCPRTSLCAQVEVPTSFETIGHVLHLNLKEQARRPLRATENPFFVLRRSLALRCRVVPPRSLCCARVRV